jgi:hypothetical protein
MKQQWRRTDQLPRGNVQEFPSAATGPDEASAALDLVYQAADAFRGLQERARETEARAQSLCQQASERVRQAEMRAEAAERAYRELMVAVDQKLKDAYRALEQAQANVGAQMDKQVAAEFRAQRAEVEAREVKRALDLVEDAIRRKLLTDSVREIDRLTAVA